MPTRPSLSRRDTLLGLLSVVTGCAGTTAQPVRAPAAPAVAPLTVARLDNLLPRAGLRYLIEVKPREIAETPWLVSPIHRLVDDAGFNLFAAKAGFDLRQIPEAVVAAYGGEAADETIYLIRHNAPPSALERLFRARFTGPARRHVERDDLLRVGGPIGTSKAELLLAGNDVAGFQFNGDTRRGPLRVAALYAKGALTRSPTVFSEEPLLSLRGRVGPALLRAFALGPFEGELGKGLSGLLAGATAVAGTVRPSSREGLLVIITVAGDFTKTEESASKELVHTWQALAQSELGHLLALDKPREAPIATHGAEAVAVAVELDPDALAKGLATVTKGNLSDIMG